MKKLSLKITAIVILVAGSFISCQESDILNGTVPFEYGATTRASGDILHDGFFRYVDGERLYFTVSANKFIVKINENMAESAIESSFRSDASLQMSDISVISGNEFKLMRFDDNSRNSTSQLTAELMSNDAISFVGYVIVDETGRKTSALTNQVNVRLKNENDFPILLEAITPYDIVKVRQDEFDSRIHLLTVNCVSGKSALQIANELHETGLFEFATPDLLLFIRYATNDTHFSQQWGLRNTGQFGGTAGIDIRVQQAWTITTGSPNIRIAILDSGVDLNHPDLRDNLLQGFNAVTGNAGPGAGAPPAVNVRNRAHGTAVAGIAAARGNNNRGIAGVAHTSRILPISMGGGDATRAYRVTRGINWARLNGARVINMSFGVDSTPDVISALNAATAANIVLVAASGNGDINNFGRPVVYFPASRPDVIAVGAIDSQGHRAGFSDHGPNLDVVAPGENIFTTGMLGDPAILPDRIMNNGIDGVYFTRIRGTSYAAPHVAGVAALMLSVNPNLTAQQVRNIIKNTANRGLPGVTFGYFPGRPNGTWNNQFGHGLVNAATAVAASFVISGPSAVCAGTIGTFTIPSLPPVATVRWIADAPLFRVSTNNQAATIGHTGATTPANSRIRAEISISGQVVHTAWHDVTVNRPTIISMETPPAVQIGSMFPFTVNHNASADVSPVWSVVPNNGVLLSPRNNNTMEIGFSLPGNYIVTVSVTNACGTDTRSQQVIVTGTPPGPPVIYCDFCGILLNCPRCLAPPILLNDPEEKAEE